MIQKNYPKLDITFRCHIPRRWICFEIEIDDALVTNMQNMPKRHSETYKILQNPSNKSQEAFKTINTSYWTSRKTIHKKEKTSNKNNSKSRPNLPSPQSPGLLTKRCKLAMRWHRANNMIRATRIDRANKGACLRETVAWLVISSRDPYAIFRCWFRFQEGNLRQTYK